VPVDPRRAELPPRSTAVSEGTCWPPCDGEFKGRRKKAGLQSSGNPLPVFPCVVGSVTLAAHGLNVRSALTSPSPNFTSQFFLFFGEKWSEPGSSEYGAARTSAMKATGSSSRQQQQPVGVASDC